MNLVSWIRENAAMFQVTPAADPSEYSIDYGEGTASVSWSFGDELYLLDVDFRNFTAKSSTSHERAPEIPIREIEGPIYLVYGQSVNLAVQLKACADAHDQKAKECYRHNNVEGGMWCHKITNLLYAVLRGDGWVTVVP